MSSHIVILDIGKTNKKLLVFDEQYQVVLEQSEVLEETLDEDGFPCEDIDKLIAWCLDRIQVVLRLRELNIKAINFSAYGASFVWIDEDGRPQTPLYNYLKPLDQGIKDLFYKTHGSEADLAVETCSPALGLLNSGLQIYRLKQHSPERYRHIRYALHLPQFLSYLFTGIPIAEMTSIGCHTMLWNFKLHHYHNWVLQEGIHEKFPILQSAETTASKVIEGKQRCIGTGLHDSSSALIPYLRCIDQPFVLISTGTWCIALNPFNSTPLTDTDLQRDCLCYLSFQGKPVKASRLFLGHEHQEESGRIASHFGMDASYFHSVSFDPAYTSIAGLDSDGSYPGPQGLMRSGFDKRSLADMDNAAAAYHVLMWDLVRLQVRSIQWIRTENITAIYVDGGFSKNNVFMHILAQSFPECRVYAASVPQASALGAAMVIHSDWNDQQWTSDLIQIIPYS